MKEVIKVEEQTNFENWSWEEEIRKTEEEEKQRFGAEKLKNEETLDISKVLRVDERIFEFTRPDGTIRKVKRKFYVFEDRTVLVPISLHRKIAKFVKNFGKDIKVQVFISGSGIRTRYDAVPIVERK